MHYWVVFLFMGLFYIHLRISVVLGGLPMGVTRVSLDTWVVT